jgi:hypothetical protein
LARLPFTSVLAPAGLRFVRTGQIDHAAGSPS